jgi:phage terminase large subunit GpA-like protein
VTVYRKGFPVRQWVKKREHLHNEPLDIRAYNVAALIALNPDLVVSHRQLAARAEERKKATPTPPEPARQPAVLGRRINWVTGWK